MLRRRVKAIAAGWGTGGAAAWGWTTRFAPWVGAVVSGIMMAAAFPPWGQAEAAWFGLVPLLLAVRGRGWRRAIGLGMLAGCVSWGGMIWWISKVTIGGMLLLVTYCAAYTALFAWGASALMGWMETGSRARRLLLLPALAGLWAGLEYLRSTLFTGFAWNGLGISQYEMVSLIQVARWGGVYAVSALMVMINAAVALSLVQMMNAGWTRRRGVQPELLVAFSVLGLVLLTGARSLRSDAEVARTPVRIGLVQPCIPQHEKWTAEFVASLYDRLETWSERALKVDGLDLLVWPETAVPDYLRDSEASYSLVQRLAAHGVPLLAGTMDFRWPETGPPHYFNSSFLFDEEARLVEVYDKRHLVMFGEYIPLERFLPFLNALTPINESFRAGEQPVIFSLGDSLRFSALICFEDTVSHLARQAVRAGARLLVNQTNDAWFDVSGASWQHMTHSVFRCVETGVPAVRSANTGISCAIDHRGRVTARLADDQGHSLFPGFLTARVFLPPEEMDLTPYTRVGDVFAGSCAVFAGAVFIRIFLSRRRGRGYIEELDLSPTHQPLEHE